MFRRLSRIIRRERDPQRLREEAENRLRAEQELRQAEQGKSEERRGYEAYGDRPTYGRR